MDWDHYSFTNWVVHTISGAAVVGYVVGLLPLIAAIPPFAFYCIQLYESKTVKRWIHRRRTRRLAQLEAQITKLKSLQKHD